MSGAFYEHVSYIYIVLPVIALTLTFFLKKIYFFLFSFQLFSHSIDFISICTNKSHPSIWHSGRIVLSSFFFFLLSMNRMNRNSCALIYSLTHTHTHVNQTSRINIIVCSTYLLPQYFKIIFTFKYIF